jgi:very-short-patch-repair endonuclease
MVMLDRHEQRREAGIPTISVLRGPAGSSVGMGRRWAAGRSRSVVVPAGAEPTPEALVDAWVDTLAGARDLSQDAIAWLARRLDRPALELGPAIGRKTPYEREAFLDAVLPCGSATSVEAAGRWLLARSADNARPPGLAARLGVVLAASQGEGLSGVECVVKALHQLVPQGAAPVLLVVRPATAHDPRTWIDLAVKSLARLAEVEPRLTLLLAIEPEVLAAYQTLASESRAQALIRAGIVDIAALSGPEITRRLDAVVPGASDRLAGSIRRLAADGAPEGLVDLFCEAARAGAEAAPGRELALDPEHDDRARSAAERFLFERLETLPQTTGRFALNAQLAIPFGPAHTMEVDLLARDLDLAIEIDGYYHFRDADAYRRDRRKDLELQKRGFLVVRVLAEDVVARLEAVLDLILAAVATNRARIHS